MLSGNTVYSLILAADLGLINYDVFRQSSSLVRRKAKVSSTEKLVIISIKLNKNRPNSSFLSSA